MRLDTRTSPLATLWHSEHSATPRTAFWPVQETRGVRFELGMLRPGIAWRRVRGSNTMSEDAVTAAPAAAEKADKVGRFEARIFWEIKGRPGPAVLAAHFGSRSPHEATFGNWIDRWKYGHEDDDFQDKVIDKLMSIGLDPTKDPEQIAREMKELLEVMNDRQLMRACHRSILASSITASFAMARAAPKIAERVPQQLGAGIQRAAAVIPFAVEGMKQIEMLDSAAPVEPIKDEKEEEVDAGERFSHEMATFAGHLN